MAQKSSSTFPFREVLLATTLLALAACSTPPPTNNSLEPTRTPAPVRNNEATPKTNIETEAPANTEVPTEIPITPTPAIQLESCANVSLSLEDKTPAARRSAGQIVYLTADGNIALTDATGRRSTKVTTDAFISPEKGEGRIYQFPTFSNDGKSLAFIGIDLHNSGRNVTQTVHVADAVANADLTNLYTTTQDNIPYLDWSPDGATVAFLTIRSGAGEIRLAPRAGGIVNVLDSGSSAYWHWRSDSSAILAHLSGRYTVDNAEAHLSVIGTLADAGAQKTINQITAPPGRFQSPHYAPNGKFMLYEVAISPQSEALVLANANGEPICSVAALDEGAYFAWSPNGRQIAVMDSPSAVQRPKPLLIFDLATGKRTQIDRDTIAFFWSPDGQKIAVYSIVSDVLLTVLDPSQKREPAADPTAIPSDGNIALRIEMIDAASGNAIQVADTLPSEQFARLFQFFDQYSRALSPWSPDSRNLAFVSFNRDTKESEVGVATITRSGNQVAIKRVASGTLAFWSPN